MFSSGRPATVGAFPRSSLSNGCTASQSAIPSTTGLPESEATEEPGSEVNSPLKKQPATRSEVSARHYFETLLGSPMFKKANLDSQTKEDHGIKQWLLHNIVWYFIVKAGHAELGNLYAGKQDGIVINRLFKLKEAEGAAGQPQTGVRSANGMVVDASTLAQLANASSTSRGGRQQQQSAVTQAVQELLGQKKQKPVSQLANTFRDGDSGDRGVRRRFLVLNERFLSDDKRQFSFTKEWATVQDRGIDPEAKKLFEVFETKEIEEWDFAVGPMLDGEYGVAPWSTQLKLLPQTPASHNLSSGEETAAPVPLELPFCTFDLQDSLEVRVSRPFHPFEKKKEVSIQTCEELEEAVPPRYLLTLGGRMPEYLNWDQGEIDKGAQQKRKYAEAVNANCPDTTWQNEITLPYCIDRSKSARSIQGGNFVISFKKRAHSEKRKLVLNESDSDEED